MVDLKQILNNVIATLDNVTVKGYDNLDRLLGSIHALKECVEAINRAERLAAKNNQNAQDDEPVVELVRMEGPEQ